MSRLCRKRMCLRLMVYPGLVLLAFEKPKQTKWLSLYSGTQKPRFYPQLKYSVEVESTLQTRSRERGRGVQAPPQKFSELG